MRVEIQHRISNLRLWEHDGSKFGDKYQLFLELIWLSKDEVELSGLTEKVSKEHWLCIRDEFERLGIRRVLCKRYRNGELQERWQNVGGDDVVIEG